MRKNNFRSALAKLQAFYDLGRQSLKEHAAYLQWCQEVSRLENRLNHC
jgi:hypothetical protein